MALSDSRFRSAAQRTAGGPAGAPRGFDLLSLPGLRRFARWRHARLCFQLPLLALALLVVVDGLTGRQLAPRNVATTTVWLHYRGLVVIALAVLGNAFCAGCPLMLTRGPSRWLAARLPARLRWPRALRGKWVVIALTIAFFFSYELFDLWASPWLTAWLVIGYFVAALAVDTLFPAGTFCRHICPLGNFNFMLSTASPTQVTTVDPGVCGSCVHKPCLHGRESHADPSRASGSYAFIPLAEVRSPNGEGNFPGCESNLFVPAMESSQDCTLCLNCVRACPYDNVALRLRSPTREAEVHSWRRRGRLSVAVLAVLLAFYGLLNAAAMVAPFHGFATGLARFMGTGSEALLLATLFLLVGLAGLLAASGAALLADLAGGAEPVRPATALLRWGYVSVILAFGFWASHYLFHFLTGALAAIPVLTHFFALRGLPLDPDWRLARLVPTALLFPLTAGLTTAYSLLAAWAAVRIALRDFGRRGAFALWPMLLYVMAFSALGLWLLAQPMEMRGTLLGPTY